MLLAFVLLSLSTSEVHAQSFSRGAGGGASSLSGAGSNASALSGLTWTGSSAPNSPGENAALAVDEPGLGLGSELGTESTAADPVALEPTAGGGYDHYDAAPAATWRQIPFSRVGVGADISPLGVGIKSAIVLNHYFDARLMGNYLNIQPGSFKINGFRVNADFHFRSAAAALDFYPWGSVFRISPGLLFINGNQMSATSAIDPGTSFSIHGQTYYSADPTKVPGATPLTGTGVLGLHRHTMAPTITGGFGKFIPRSNRHWSFPSEFGVAFTGPPTANVNFGGWACLDAKETQCSDIGDPANPIAIKFNDNLQTQLTKWRRSLGLVTVYPLASYGVMYSFNIR